ncbi:hypothetical protein [Streptomyces azureus]|nr:hypothetical protein [Streptomyces azureus]
MRSTVHAGPPGTAEIGFCAGQMMALGTPWQDRSLPMLRRTLGL